MLFTIKSEHMWRLGYCLNMWQKKKTVLLTKIMFSCKSIVIQNRTSCWRNGFLLITKHWKKVGKAEYKNNYRALNVKEINQSKRCFKITGNYSECFLEKKATHFLLVSKSIFQSRICAYFIDTGRKAFQISSRCSIYWHC